MKSIDRHMQYIALIPAYLHRQLTAAKAAEAARHFRECAECSAELQYARQLHEHFQQHLTNPVEGTDMQPDVIAAWLSPAHEQQNFDRLWSRIEYDAATPSKSIRRWWLPAAAAAALLLTVALPWYQKSLAPDYRTMANSDSHATCGQLRIRFIDNFSAADMQSLLQSVDAHIVDGPTPHGVYTLRTNQPAAKALQTLHLHPAVALVEPTDC